MADPLVFLFFNHNYKILPFSISIKFLIDNFFVTVLLTETHNVLNKL